MAEKTVSKTVQFRFKSEGGYILKEETMNNKIDVGDVVILKSESSPNDIPTKFDVHKIYSDYTVEITHYNHNTNTLGSFTVPLHCLKKINI